MKKFLSLIAILFIGVPLSDQEFDGNCCTSIMVDRLEQMAIDGSLVTDSYPTLLNAYTDGIYQEALRSWKALEKKYWLKFGIGF